MSPVNNVCGECGCRIDARDVFCPRCCAVGGPPLGNWFFGGIAVLCLIYLIAISGALLIAWLRELPIVDMILTYDHIYKIGHVIAAVTIVTHNHPIFEGKK